MFLNPYHKDWHSSKPFHPPLAKLGKNQKLAFPRLLIGVLAGFVWAGWLILLSNFGFVLCHNRNLLTYAADHREQ